MIKRRCVRSIHFFPSVLVTKLFERVRSIHSLPNDLVIEIIARVAAHSLKDLISVKLSCKRWNELSDHWCLYKQASLPTFVEWKDLGTNPRIVFKSRYSYSAIYANVSQQSEQTKRKISTFLQKCFDVGNPHALYRRGVIDYFEGVEPERAVGWLKKAANAGNFGAQYVICIISIFSESEQDKENGIVFLNVIIKERKQVRKARLQLINILYRRLVTNIPHRLDTIPACCTIPGHDIIGRNLTYLLRATDSDDEDEAGCSLCRCYLEIYLINELLLSAGHVPNTCVVSN